MNDGSFNCLNRADERPFSKPNSGTATTNETENWLHVINKPCPRGKKSRRCIGSSPDVCVQAFCKLFLKVSFEF